MSVSSSISRLTEYYRRHGLAATLSRAQLGLRRAFFASRMVVFYCDLHRQYVAPLNPPGTFYVECLAALAELRPEYRAKITGFWNSELANRNLQERFGRGALLWVALCGDQLAGYGWTLNGQTIEPYYFPLAKDDVHLFDFHVFPDF